MKNESDYRYWLENALRWHRYTAAETAVALDTTPEQVRADAARLGVLDDATAQQGEEPLRVLPYPGGRHPRIGFLEGAVHPRRDTKVSIFAPWEATGYVVVDVPEAVWHHNPVSGRDALLFLAHEHAGFTPDWAVEFPLPLSDWKRHPDGTLSGGHALPVGVSFSMTITPSATDVRMRLALTNHTDHTLTGLRVQNCVMLKGLPGFTAQTGENARFHGAVAASVSEDGRRAVLTAWENCVRAWGNPPCPCIHSDPQFADCLPGQTVHLQGWLRFYEGNDLDAEIERCAALI